jgi:hypothetical protein
LLGVIVWLGGGLYDSFLAWEIKRRRGTPGEVTLARVYVRWGPVIVGALLVVAVTGALQASLLGWGWFSHFWLGAKQALMLAALAALGGALPIFAGMSRALRALPDDAPELSDEARALFRRSEPFILVMRLSALAALFLAVFRPG